MNTDLFKQPASNGPASVTTARSNGALRSAGPLKAGCLLRVSVLICGCLFASFPARADVILLKNGGRIEGRIERTEPGPPCERCDGKGGTDCPSCGGNGKSASGGACPVCAGTGRVKCGPCKGEGTGEKRYVILMVGGMRTTIAAGEVLSIEKGDIPPEDLLPPRESYAARRRKLGGDSARGARARSDGELRLARWALSRRLFPEAAKHARQVAETSPALREEALEVARSAEAKLDAAAVPALKAAFECIRARRFAEGRRLLEEAIARHAKAPVVSDPARERAHLAGTARDLAGTYGGTLAEIARAVARRIELACRECTGAGESACADCGGTGAGTCARCRGTGALWCLECNGTQWRVCLPCGGTGKPAGAQFGMPAACPECRGRRIVKCVRCRKGRMSCPPCGGKGKAPRGCRKCAGSGRRKCAACLGTGLARVTRFRWGPVKELGPGPVVVVQASRAPGTVRSAHPARKGNLTFVRRIPVWQGVRRGCIVTCVRARDLHDGALSEQTAAVLGTRRELLLVCIDNRDGRDEVAFAPGGRGMRLVTDDAQQVDATPPPGAAELAKLSAEHLAFRAALMQLGPGSVLPGAAASFTAAFPAGTDLAAAESVYLGREDPLRLERRYVTEAELAEIRETLR